MQATVRQLSDAMNGLRDLGTKPMNAQLAYTVSKLMVKVEDALKPFNMTRENIMKEMNGQVQGQFIVFSDDPKENMKQTRKFTQALEPILNETAELNGIQKLSVNKLGTLEVAPETLRSLNWLLEE